MGDEDQTRHRIRARLRSSPCYAMRFVLEFFFSRVCTNREEISRAPRSSAGRSEAFLLVGVRNDDDSSVFDLVGYSEDLRVRYSFPTCFLPRWVIGKFNAIYRDVFNDTVVPSFFSGERHLTLIKILVNKNKLSRSSSS